MLDAPRAWCGAEPGPSAACDDCGLALCDDCLADAVGEMERLEVPDEAGCPFCVGVLPDLPGLVDFVCRELKVSTTELAELWREARREGA